MSAAKDKNPRLGRYIVKTYGEESVRAFVPPPLPPNPPVRLEAVQRLLEQANQSLGRLDGLASVLPNLPLFIHAYVRKEAVLSSQGGCSLHFCCAPQACCEPILYLSLYFKQHRPAYYDLLERVRAKGEWETWLEFFLTGVRDTAEQAATAARRILAVFEDHHRKIEALGRPAASVLRVFEHMQRNPIVSIPAAAASIGLSAPTVAKALEHMHQLGMLREITGRRRHRLFVYDAYLAILSEGTEPTR